MLSVSSGWQSTGEGGTTGCHPHPPCQGMVLPPLGTSLLPPNSQTMQQLHPVAHTHVAPTDLLLSRDVSQP